ncbi:unnamed protein product [Chrysoparadoxa australica]
MIMKSQFTDVLARNGTEKLRYIIGDFFQQLMHLIVNGGGDIIRLAGDALIAMFPMHNICRMAQVVQEAAAVALESVVMLDGSSFHGKTVSLRVGLDMGGVSIMVLGSADRGWQYVVAGEPFANLDALLENGVSGEVLVTRKIWEAIKRSRRKNWSGIQVSQAAGSPTQSPYFKLQHSGQLCIMRHRYQERETLLQESQAVDNLQNLRLFVPGAVLHACEAEGSGWFSYIQRVTMLFIKAGVDKAKLMNARGGTGLLDHLQNIFSMMQEVVQRYDGVIKEFTVDDKGLVLMVAMGVPPSTGDNQPEKACLAALEMVDVLRDRADCSAYVGIGTGMVFTASVGKGRRELAMVGDAVNIAARLMSTAFKRFGPEEESKVLVADTAYEDAKFRIEFVFWDTVRVKNKLEQIACWVPQAPKKGGYAVMLPGNVDMVVRNSVAGANVAELATRRIERLSRGEGGGLIVLEGLPGMGKSYLLQGLAQQWRHTFSPSIHIICDREHQNDLLPSEDCNGSVASCSADASSPGSSLNAQALAAAADEYALPSGFNSNRRGSASSTGTNSSTSTGPGSTRGVGTERDGHPLCSWRQVLCCLLLEFRSHVLTYAGACSAAHVVPEGVDTPRKRGRRSTGGSTLPTIPQQSPNARTKAAQLLNGLNGLDLDSSDTDTMSEEEEGSAVNLSVTSTETGVSTSKHSLADDDMSYGTCGSHTVIDGGSQLDPDGPDDASDVCENTLLDKGDDSSSEAEAQAEAQAGGDQGYSDALIDEEDAESSPCGSKKASKSGSEKRHVKFKQVGEITEQDESNSNRKPPARSLPATRSHPTRAHTRSNSAFATTKSMLSLLGDETHAEQSLLASLDAISGSSQNLPQWAGAFGAYPKAGEDTPWARGMYLHFFFDQFMSESCFSYWLLGEFLGADMPAEDFSNDCFKEFKFAAMENFPCSLPDAIMEILSFTSQQESHLKMPITFRAALIFDTQQGVSQPSLDLTQRVLSSEELNSSYLIMFTSSPLPIELLEDSLPAALMQHKQRRREVVQNCVEAFASTHQARLRRVAQSWKGARRGSSSRSSKGDSSKDTASSGATANGTCTGNASSAVEKGSTKNRAFLRPPLPSANPRSSILLPPPSPTPTQEGGISPTRQGSRSGSYASSASRRGSFAGQNSAESDLLTLAVELGNSLDVSLIQLAPLDFAATRKLVTWSLDAESVTNEVAVTLFALTLGMPFYISEYCTLLNELEVGLTRDDGCWQFDPETGGLAGSMCVRVLGDVRLDGLVTMRSKVEGFLHRMTSQQQNVLRILSCMGQHRIPLSLFVCIYPHFISVTRERFLEDELAVLECSGVISMEEDEEKSLSISFRDTVLHQVVYWEMPIRMRQAVHSKVCDWYKHQGDSLPMVVQHSEVAGEKLMALKAGVMAGKDELVDWIVDHCRVTLVSIGCDESLLTSQLVKDAAGVLPCYKGMLSTVASLTGDRYC